MTLPLSSSVSTYGGPFVDAVQQVDPQSEISSTAFNPLVNDVAAMTVTAPRALFQFLGDSAAPAIASTNTWATGFDSVWGNAQAVQPTLTRTGTGAITVSLPASVPDGLGNTNLVNIRNGTARIASGTTPGHVILNVTASNTFTLKLYTASGSPSDFQSTLVFVELF